MPVKVSKLKGGYRVSTPGGVKARHTTKKKAAKQRRLLNAIEHGFVPGKTRFQLPLDKSFGMIYFTYMHMNHKGEMTTPMLPQESHPMTPKSDPTQMVADYINCYGPDGLSEVVPTGPSANAQASKGK